MTVPAPPSRSLSDLRDLTPARVGLGRVGAGLPTRALLEFTLDHARARDAVHAVFDVSALISSLNGVGLEAPEVSSCARDRKDYLRRPDLGRKLDPASRQLLTSRTAGSFRLAVVVGDGLSPAAVNAHAMALVARLMPRLATDRIEIGCAVVASGARVALGDEIGAILGARMVVALIGERPGVSAPDMRLWHTWMISPAPRNRHGVVPQTLRGLSFRPAAAGTSCRRSQPPARGCRAYPANPRPRGSPLPIPSHHTVPGRATGSVSPPTPGGLPDIWRSALSPKRGSPPRT
jgi:ethanolamine ammonia-lyase small subunit